MMKVIWGYRAARIKQSISVMLIVIIGTSVLFSFTPSPWFSDASPMDQEKTGKLSATLLSYITSNENPETELDVIASMTSDVEWRAATRAILQTSQQTQIRAIHQLVNAISLKTTVGELENLASLPIIHKLWMDIGTQLDFSANEINQDKIPRTPGTYLRPQDVASTSALASLGFNGSRTIVAILDTGIDATHPDLDDFDDNETTNDLKVVGQVSFVEGDPFPFDLNGHGTYCAGLVAGTGFASNGTYAGIAPGAQLLSVKVMLSDGTGYSSWIIRGIEWSLTHGADIILLPFSTFGIPGDPLSEAISRATEQGVLIVTAAGDRGPDHMTILSPGESLASLTVGAYNSETHEVAEFSSRGPTFDMRSKPDLVAPGVEVISTALHDIIPIEIGNLSVPISQEDIDLEFLGVGQFGQIVNTSYALASTTAASAAIAAGAASLLLQGCRYASPECLAIGICQGSTPIRGEPNVEGHGLLNATAAYYELSALHDPLLPSFRPRSVTPGLPYYGILGSQGDIANVTLLMSNFASPLATIIQSSLTNATILHLLMGMFYLAVENSSVIPFAFLNVEQELHWTTLPMEDYTKATGILSYGDLLIIPRIESWHIQIAPFSNAFRFTFFLVNVGPDDIRQVRLYSLWNFELFYGGNNTSTQIGSFNSSTQFFQVTRNWVPPNETLPINQTVGFNTTIAPTNYEVGTYSEVSNHLLDDALNGSTSHSSDEGIGIGTRWDLGDLTVGTDVINVTLTLGFGNTTAAVLHGINETGHSTPPLPLPDLCMIRVGLPRIGSTEATYHTTALVLNIGDRSVSAIAAFLTNRTQPMGGAIFARYFELGLFDPFESIVLEVEWTPETDEVYFAGWLVAPEIILDWNNLTLIQDHYPLDNTIFRDAFVSTPPTMRLISPNMLPYGPMTLRFPNDFALYNLSLLTSTPIEHLQIMVDGSAANWVNTTPTRLDDVRGAIGIQLTILVPTFIKSDIYTANIRFQASDGWQLTIPLWVNITYPKSIILFDTIHNLGLDLTDLSNFADLDIDTLLEIFQELSDSIFTGYSRLRDEFAAAQLNLTEIPLITELNATVLSLFDGLVICDPEIGFTAKELANITQFIDSGFRVLIFADNPSASNHTALNALLAQQNLQVIGSITSMNTSELSPTSPFTRGITTITTEGGTQLQVNAVMDSFAWVNGTPIGVYQPNTGRELFVFGCSAVCANSYLYQLHNQPFVNQVIHHLFRKTVEITIQPTGGNGSTFRIGRDAGFIIDIHNQTEQGVENLEIFVLYQMPNDTLLFFVAFEVKEGRYGTFLLANWTENVVGTYSLIVFTTPSEYGSTMAQMDFYYIEAPEETEPPPKPNFLGMMIIEIFLAIVLLLLVLSGYSVRQLQRGRRMLTPTISEELIQKVDNALNTTQALLRELEWILTDRRLDRLEKLHFAAGTIGIRLDRMLETLRELAKETGA